MCEIIQVKQPTKRRHFSKAYKAKIVAACQQPGASAASVALANGLNANLAHRWRRALKPKAAVNSVPGDFIPVAVHERASQGSENAVVILEVGSIKVNCVFRPNLNAHSGSR
jgi:transposase-like protein